MTKRPAFSLVELTITILIIGIIIAGIIAANGVINRARIATARSLTQTAPINTLSDVTFWFESSLVTSFNGNEDSNGASVNYWYDNNSSVNKNNAMAGSTPPVYSNTINKIHALGFDGTNASMTVNGSALNASDYTICLVEKRQSNKANNYFIGDSAVSTANQTLILGYIADGTVIHSQGTGKSYTSNVSN